jgi:hypothetical protein
LRRDKRQPGISRRARISTIAARAGLGQYALDDTARAWLTWKGLQRLGFDRRTE